VRAFDRNQQPSAECNHKGLMMSGSKKIFPIRPGRPEKRAPVPLSGFARWSVCSVDRATYQRADGGEIGSNKGISRQQTGQRQARAIERNIRTEARTAAERPSCK